MIEPRKTYLAKCTECGQFVMAWVTRPSGDGGMTLKQIADQAHFAIMEGLEVSASKIIWTMKGHKPKCKIGITARHAAKARKDSQ